MQARPRFPGYRQAPAFVCVATGPGAHVTRLHLQVRLLMIVGQAGSGRRLTLKSAAKSPHLPGSSPSFLPHFRDRGPYASNRAAYDPQSGLRRRAGRSRGRRHGGLITRRIATLRPDQLDRASAELAMPTHLVGADESITAVQRAAVDGARTGRTDEAREIVTEFRPGADDSVTPWTRVALLYAVPLLADDELVEREFRRVLGENLARWPAYRARLLLEYGAWLRRRRRPADARPAAHRAADLRGTRAAALGRARPAEPARNSFTSPTGRSAPTSTGSSRSWASPPGPSCAP